MACMACIGARPAPSGVLGVIQQQGDTLHMAMCHGNLQRGLAVVRMRVVLRPEAEADSGLPESVELKLKSVSFV